MPRTEVRIVIRTGRRKLSRPDSKATGFARGQPLAGLAVGH